VSRDRPADPCLPQAIVVLTAADLNLRVPDSNPELTSRVPERPAEVLRAPILEVLIAGGDYQNGMCLA